MKSIRDIRKNSDEIITEAMTAYQKRVTKKGKYVMTTEDLASHMHYLNWYINEHKKVQRERMYSFERLGFFDKREWKAIEDTWKIYDKLAIPRSLITVVDKKELDLF